MKDYTSKKKSEKIASKVCNYLSSQVGSVVSKLANVSVLFNHNLKLNMILKKWIKGN